MRAILFLLCFITPLAFADSTYSPLGPATFDGTATVQVTANGGQANPGYRIRNISSSVQCFSWSAASANIVAPVVPTAGVPSQTTICMIPTSVETFYGLPNNAYFQASTSTGFEIEAGIGF